MPNLCSFLYIFCRKSMKSNWFLLDLAWLSCWIFRSCALRTPQNSEIDGDKIHFTTTYETWSSVEVNCTFVPPDAEQLLPCAKLVNCTGVSSKWHLLRFVLIDKFILFFLWRAALDHFFVPLIPYNYDLKLRLLLLHKPMATNHLVMRYKGSDWTSGLVKSVYVFFLKVIAFP